jgi:hypothetical protein
MTANPSLATPDDEQPASEWASRTLSALDPAKDSSPAPVAQSAPETPGVSMPGSFPIPRQRVLLPDLEGIASDAFNTAKQYAQVAAQGAQTAVQTAGEKVGEYLPSSVASYLSSEQSGTQQEAHHNSTQTLPSQETSQNYHPSTVGGVGTLPGPPGEIGVAALPDERTGGKSVDQAVNDSIASTEVVKTSPIMTTTNNNPVHSHSSDPLERNTGYIPDALQNDTSLAKLPEERRLESLPSHDDETGGRLGKSDGVGALPGSANETDVALLPDERKEAQETSSGVGGGASTDRTLPGSSYIPSPLGQVHSLPQTIGRQQPFSRDEEKVFGADAKNDLDTPHTEDDAKGQDSAVLNGSTGQAKHAVGAGSGGLAGAGSASQIASEVTAIPKKSGFMHKVKGEMKILSGKLGHNEAKIEEGRKMMGKN